MSRALIEEFCRISGLALKPEFFRRCQREFRDNVLPLYDERDRLLEENTALKADLEKATERMKNRRSLAS